MKIVDKKGIIVPVGVYGEIYLRGYPMFLGYKNQPDLQKEVVTTDGWFKTG